MHTLAPGIADQENLTSHVLKVTHAHYMWKKKCNDDQLGKYQLEIILRLLI